MEKVTGLFGTIGRSFKNLTKREQVMIYGLVIVAVAAILIFLILLPAMTHISELSAEVSELQIQEQEMRMTIASAPSYESTYEESEKRFNAFKKQLYTPMDPESLDEMVTSFLVDSGLTPKDLSMTVLQQTQIPAFAPPALTAEATPTAGTDGAVTTDTGSTDASGGGAAGGVQAYVYTISISVEGDRTDLANLSENIAKTTGYELNSYTFQSSEEDIVEGITNKGTIQAMISIFVYVDQATGSTLPALDSSTLGEN